jgi:hypothetical protein
VGDVHLERLDEMIRSGQEGLCEHVIEAPHENTNTYEPPAIPTLSWPSIVSSICDARSATYLYILRVSRHGIMQLENGYLLFMSATYVCL